MKSGMRSRGMTKYINEFINVAERELGKNIVTGEFGTYMEIDLVNDGPVTIIIDTKNKE